MVKWYDRIGNTIKMKIDGKWIKGTIINGYRIHQKYEIINFVEYI